MNEMLRPFEARLRALSDDELADAMRKVRSLVDVIGAPVQGMEAAEAQWLWEEMSKEWNRRGL